MLRVAPITIQDAKRYVAQHHRHSAPPLSGLAAVSVVDVDGTLRGVGILGRPVSRILDNGSTVEALRVCTDGAHNACSMLYGALARIARALGYSRIVTYTLVDESGASLRAAGWQLVAQVRPRDSWSFDCRPRPVQPDLWGREPRRVSRRVRWERELAA